MQPRSTRTNLAAVVVLALASALTFVTVSGAGATPPNLSTDDAINTYLTSIGATGAVWQGTTANPSHKNYAGPSCPGSSWNCVPATTPIVQITDAGGYNVFACGGLDCVVVQIALKGGQNGGACLRGDNTSNNQTQECVITQVNDGNQNSTNAASISQNIQQSGGSEQTARQIARIVQDNSLGKNIARINQVIGQRQDTKSGSTITQTQEAHQAATVDQLTTEGDNLSTITERQDQSQKASKGTTSITQNQNKDSSGTNTDPFCDGSELGTPAFDQDKNQCAEVVQASNDDLLLLPEGGSLDSSLLQRINESQSASASPLVNQFQGESPLLSGQGGSVDQISSGVATNEADEDTFQSQTTSGIPALGVVNQTKYTGDPRCCQFQQSNPNSSSDIDQETNQFASSFPAAVQVASFTGTCESSGSCHVLQTSTINGSTAEPNECDGGEEGGFCEEVMVCSNNGEGTVCAPPPPPPTTTTTEIFTGPN
jgi:hypothetical protein